MLGPDAWLRTGDLGCLDALGQLWLLGRLKDTIKSGGENVYSSEVEAVLQRHPAVAAVAVVGLPHGRLGEQVGMPCTMCAVCAVCCVHVRAACLRVWLSACACLRGCIQGR